jgi:hypothetical protein
VEGQSEAASEATEPLGAAEGAALRRASLDRGRKVGLGPGEAYRAMLAGAAGPAVQVEEEETDEEEETSDDVEAELAMLARRRTAPRAAQGLHSQEEDPFQEQRAASPPTRGAAGGGLGAGGGLVGGGGGMGHMANLALSVGGAAQRPPQLAAGRLAHPAAQRLGLQAVGGGAQRQAVGQRQAAGPRTQETDTESQAAGALSGPEEEEEDFWD